MIGQTQTDQYSLSCNNYTCRIEQFYSCIKSSFPKIWFLYAKGGHQLYLKTLVSHFFSFGNPKEAVQAPWHVDNLGSPLITRDADNIFVIETQ